MDTLIRVVRSYLSELNSRKTFSVLGARGEYSPEERREKREECQQHAREEGEAVVPEVVPPHALDMPAEELQRFQAADDTLEAANKAADREPDTAGVGFFRRDGLLYRRWTPPGRSSEERSVEQLVIPRTCRQTVLNLAHTIPLAGHLGRDKMTKRVLQRFYWPTLYWDVAEYYRSCGECQKTCGQRVRRAPLIPLLIMGKPFDYGYCGTPTP